MASSRVSAITGGSVRVRIQAQGSPVQREFVLSRALAGQLQAFWVTQPRWVNASGTSNKPTDPVAEHSLADYIHLSKTVPETLDARSSNFYMR
jgi:hypothetical protein